MSVSVTSADSVLSGMGHISYKVELSASATPTTNPTRPYVLESDTESARDRAVQQKLHNAMPNILSEVEKQMGELGITEGITGRVAIPELNPDGSLKPGQPHTEDFVGADDCVMIKVITNGDGKKYYLNKQAKMRAILEHSVNIRGYSWEMTFKDRVVKYSDTTAMVSFSTDRSNIRTTDDTLSSTCRAGTFWRSRRRRRMMSARQGI